MWLVYNYKTIQMQKTRILYLVWYSLNPLLHTPTSQLIFLFFNCFLRLLGDPDVKKNPYHIRPSYGKKMATRTKNQLFTYHVQNLEINIYYLCFTNL